MHEIILIALAAAIANYVIFVDLLGLSFFISATSNFRRITILAAATTIVLMLSSIFIFIVKMLTANHAVFNLLLPMISMLIIFLMTIFVLKLFKNLFGLELSSHNIALSLIVLNSGILYISIQSTNYENLFEATLFSLIGGIGFSLSLICFSALKENINQLPVPEVLRGNPITMITIGIVSLGFMGLIGL